MNSIYRFGTVIGSGTLGSRIALMLASSGGEVRLYDLNADQLEAARHYVEVELPRLVAGRPGALPGRLVLSRTVQAAVADTWMVVEAIPERLDLKRKMFGDLDRLAPEDAILASNSSSYPTSQFIDAVSRPGRVANTHYYGGLPEVNPPFSRPCHSKNRFCRSSLALSQSSGLPSGWQRSAAGELENVPQTARKCYQGRFGKEWRGDIAATYKPCLPQPHAPPGNAPNAVA